MNFKENQMAKVTNRIEWVDLARVIAILCVVLCHCTEAVYRFDVDYMATLSLKANLFSCSLMTFGRFGVPFFLMISGYLLLDRNYDRIKTYKFWNKTKHLVICALFWAVIGELFVIYVLQSNVTWDSAFFSIIFLKTFDMNHFWYLPMIIGIYVLIPFVAHALKDFDLDTIFKAAMVFAVLSYLVPFVISILNFWGYSDLTLEVSLGFSGGRYGVYMVMGYLIRKGYFKKYKSYLLAIAAVLTFIVYVLIQIYLFKNGFKLRNYYDSPFLFVSAVCLFELISRIEHVRFYSIIQPMAIYAFAVFLIHNFIKMYFRDSILSLTVSNFSKFIILYAVVIVLSYVLAVVISKIPKFGKYILYLK